MSYTRPLPAVDPVDDLDNLEARLAWRKSLTDTDVRALAYEYKVGNYDQCSMDAWAEYEQRFGDDARGPSKEFPKRAGRDGIKQSRRRKAKGA